MDGTRYYRGSNPRRLWGDKVVKYEAWVDLFAIRICLINQKSKLMQPKCPRKTEVVFRLHWIRARQLSFPILSFNRESRGLTNLVAGIELYTTSSAERTDGTLLSGNIFCLGRLRTHDISFADAFDSSAMLPRRKDINEGFFLNVAAIFFSF